jgi:hypothetical protein
MNYYWQLFAGNKNFLRRNLPKLTALMPPDIFLLKFTFTS